MIKKKKGNSSEMKMAKDMMGKEMMLKKKITKKVGKKGKRK